MFNLVREIVESLPPLLILFFQGLDHVKAQAQGIGQEQFSAKVEQLDTQVDQFKTQILDFQTRMLSFPMRQYSLDECQKAVEEQEEKLRSILSKRRPNLTKEYDFANAMQQYLARRIEIDEIQQELEVKCESLEDEIKKTIDDAQKIGDEIRELDKQRQLFDEKAQQVIALTGSSDSRAQSSTTELSELDQAVHNVKTIATSFGKVTMRICRLIDKFIVGETTASDIRKVHRIDVPKTVLPQHDILEKRKMRNVQAIETSSIARTDGIHVKNLAIDQGYQTRISPGGSLSVLGFLPENKAGEIISQAMRDAAKARNFTRRHGPGQQLAQGRHSSIYGITVGNVVGENNVQLHILAVESLSYATVTVGSDCTQVIATVPDLNGQEKAAEFLKDIDWTKYELIARSSSFFGDIVLKEEDAMMIWSAKPISLGEISMKDRSRLYVLQTTTKDANCILELMPLTQKPEDSFRCWTILRQGATLEETELLSLTTFT